MFYCENLPDEEKCKFNLAALAEAESGWDFNPRFQRRYPDYAAVDLNSLLYSSYCELSDYHREFANPADSLRWSHRAKATKQKISRYCWNKERCIFMDYNFVKKCHSPVLSCASLFPLWTGLATQQQAESTLKAIENFLEFDYGLSACEKNNSGQIYQWNFPNGWPPMQFITIEAFDRYGFTNAASRIAQKYIDVVSKKL